MDPEVSTPGIRKGTRVGERQKRWGKGLKGRKGEAQGEGSLKGAGDRERQLGGGDNRQRGAELGDPREDRGGGDMLAPRDFVFRERLREDPAKRRHPSVGPVPAGARCRR